MEKLTEYENLRQNFSFFFFFEEPLPQNPLEFFQWLPKDHLCVLVYLVIIQ